MREEAMVRLNVNIDHVATVRQARRALEPSPLSAAAIAELAGADGITVHLRGDRRHIQDSDVRQLRQAITTHLNVEMAATAEMAAIAAEIQPDMVTLVPENPNEISTEGGLDVRAHSAEVVAAVRTLRDAGIDVSLFIDPLADQIAASKEAGAHQIEICTSKYAHLTTAIGSLKEARRPEIASELSRIGDGCALGAKLGLRIAAGHGLTYRNVGAIAALPGMEELNIGHNIVSRAVLVGLDQAIREMIAAIRRREEQF